MSHGLIGAPASLFCCRLWITLHHILLLVSFIPSGVFVITCFVSFHALSDDLLQFSAWRIVIPSFHPMDIVSEIVSRESHLVRESSCTSVFESISIYYIFLIRVHLLTFRVCTCKKKRKKKEKNGEKKEMKRISTCMFVYNVFLHWVCV